MKCGLVNFAAISCFAGFGPLAIKELEEIETDPHAIDSDQTGDMFDVIDIPIERRFLLARTYEHGVDSDNAAAAARSSGFVRR